MTSSDARIEFLERQVAILMAKIEEQAATIAAQATEIAELKRRLGENSSNSNKPPSTDAPATRAERPDRGPSGKRPGGQRGHKGHRRELLPGDRHGVDSGDAPLRTGTGLIRLFGPVRG